MKWYDVVRNDNAVENPLIVNAKDFCGVASDDLRIGKLIDTWSPDAALWVTDLEHDGTPDDVLQNHLGLPIFSLRLQQALADAGVGGIQYLPVHIRQSTGENVPGYAVANILERRAALDRERSDFDVNPPDYFLPERRGWVAGIRRGVLKRAALWGCNIFRLDEFTENMYFSDLFRRVFEEQGFTGLSFWEVTVVD